MSSYLVIEGNLTAEPRGGHARSTGRSYVWLQIAVNERVKSEEGHYDAGPTVYYRATAFGARADHALNSLHQGDTVIVAGAYTVEGTRRDDGTTAEHHEITADHLGISLKYADAPTLRRAAVGVAL